MKELNIYDTTTQNEAMLNELKGNVFEFLIARHISIHHDCAIDFLNSIDQDYLERLKEYESYIRKVDSELFDSLHDLATQTIILAKDDLPKEVNAVRLIGKLEGKSHANEGDILLTTKDHSIPLSIKLCKSGSYVNTKSGGIKSFISKYFNQYKDHQIIQETINLKVDQYFKEMAEELYELNGLSYQDGFDTQWVDAGKSELPGKLNKNDNEIVIKFYRRLIKEVYKVFKDFQKESPKDFSSSIKKLMGLSQNKVMQLECFYKRTQNQKYIFDKIIFHKDQDLENQLLGMKILDIRDDLSSFEIEFPSLRLQIRLKPMNKFTQAALKVNCSVKSVSYS